MHLCTSLFDNSCNRTGKTIALLTCFTSCRKCLRSWYFTVSPGNAAAALQLYNLTYTICSVILTIQSEIISQESETAELRYLFHFSVDAVSSMEYDWDSFSSFKVLLLKLLHGRKLGVVDTSGQCDFIIYVASANVIVSNNNRTNSYRDSPVSLLSKFNVVTIFYYRY